MKKQDYIEIKTKNAIIFKDTAECITAISDMVGEDIRVDYSVNPPVLHIGKAIANVGDAVCVEEDGTVFVA